MGKDQVLGFVILIILNQIFQTSAETSSDLRSKDILSANRITNENSDFGNILAGRNKRDVTNDDKINRLNDKIDELSKQIEQMKEDAKKAQNKMWSIEKKLIENQRGASHDFAELLRRIDNDKLISDNKFGDTDAKCNRIEELVSKKFNENEEIGTRRLGAFESITTRIEQSFSNLTKELSTEINNNEFASSNRFDDIVEQINQIQQLITQQSIQVCNATQEKTWSNRIRDGPSQCRLWPDTKVPYEINSLIFGKPWRLIGEAINDFHSKTCIRWIPRQSEDAFVYFSKINNTQQINKTEECYTGGRRIVIIGEEFNRKDILRQMVNILGLGDEHLRNDRDEYIKLRRDNCTMEEKYTHLNGGGFYDYQSITHPTCFPKDCLQHKYNYSDIDLSCGNLGSLNVLDSNKLNEMYNCDGCHSLCFQFTNQIGFNESALVPVFENAHENRKYICRVQHNGIVLIGRGNVKTGECHYWYGEPEMATENVQFLTNPQQTKIQWTSRGSEFPKNAIPGGYSSVIVYIARCPEEPQWGESVLPQNIANYHTSMEWFKRVGSPNTCSPFDILTCS